MHKNIVFISGPYAIIFGIDDLYEMYIKTFNGQAPWVIVLQHFLKSFQKYN